MEKKKVWKRILIVIFVIFIIFLIYTIRKTIIIASLQNKLKEYQNMDNIYVKITFDNSNIVTLEQYYKDGIEKNISKFKEGNTTIMEYIYPNQRKIFRERNDNKTLTIKNLQTNEKLLQDKPNLVSYTNSLVTMPELFSISIITKVKTEEVQGKECYVLTDNKYERLYVEKSTGLAVQTIVSTIDEGNVERIIKYEYGFGTVTDKDMQEPDIEQYTIIP